MNANQEWTKASEAFGLREVSLVPENEQGEVIADNIKRLFVLTCPVEEKAWRTPYVFWELDFLDEMCVTWWHNPSSSWCQTTLHHLTCVADRKDFELLSGEGEVIKITPSIMNKCIGKTLRLDASPREPSPLMRSLEEKTHLSFLKDGKKNQTKKRI